MLLGFKKQFIEPIQIGTKVLTLRKRRKVRPKIGETIHMYSGLRTKHTVFIGNKETLRGIQNARILIERTESYIHPRVYIDRRELSLDELKQFVKYDGFKNIYEWSSYWLNGKERTGALMELYHWTDLKY